MLARWPLRERPRQKLSRSSVSALYPLFARRTGELRLGRTAVGVLAEAFDAAAPELAAAILRQLGSRACPLATAQSILDEAEVRR